MDQLLGALIIGALTLVGMLVLTYDGGRSRSRPEPVDDWLDNPDEETKADLRQWAEDMSARARKTDGKSYDS